VTYAAHMKGMGKTPGPNQTQADEVWMPFVAFVGLVAFAAGMMWVAVILAQVARAEWVASAIVLLGVAALLLLIAGVFFAVGGLRLIRVIAEARHDREAELEDAF